MIDNEIQKEFNNQFQKLKVIPCLDCVCYDCNLSSNRCSICKNFDFEKIKHICLNFGNCKLK